MKIIDVHIGCNRTVGADLDVNGLRRRRAQACTVWKQWSYLALRCEHARESWLDANDMISKLNSRSFIDMLRGILKLYKKPLRLLREADSRKPFAHMA